jgi:hypothetical protein
VFVDLLSLGWGIIATRKYQTIHELSYLIILPTSDLLVLSPRSAGTSRGFLGSFLDLNPSVATLSVILLLRICYVSE